MSQTQKPLDTIIRQVRTVTQTSLNGQTSASYNWECASLGINEDFPAILGTSLKVEESQVAWVFKYLFVIIKELQLNPEAIAKMIQNSKQLTSVKIAHCRKLTDQITDALGLHCKGSMKELYLERSGEVNFQGVGIFQLPLLQALVLREIDRINALHAERNVGRLTKLKHLDLYGSSWASDNFCNNGLIHLRDHLEFIGLCNTTISTQSTSALKSLKRLQAINIGFSRINAQQVEQILHQMLGLKKLSLWGCYGSVIGRVIINTKKMIKLSTFLKQITHLDVGSCPVEDKMFGQRIQASDQQQGRQIKRKIFPQLKHVNLWMTKVSRTRKDELRFIGINVLEDQ